MKRQDSIPKEVASWLDIVAPLRRPARIVREATRNELELGNFEQVTRMDKPIGGLECS